MRINKNYNNQKEKNIQNKLIIVMTFSSLIVASTFTITLVIIVLVVSPSLGSTMLMKSKIGLIQLSYAEIMGVVVGPGMQHDIAYVKRIENKTSLSIFATS